MSIQQDRLSPNQDDFYNHLIAAHEGLSPEESSALNARLVLLMANRIGDPDVLADIIDTAHGYTDD